MSGVGDGDFLLALARLTTNFFLFFLILSLFLLRGVDVPFVVKLC